AGIAARAYVKAHGYQNTIIVGLPRARVSSWLSQFADQGAPKGTVMRPPNIGELVSVLNAAKPGRAVTLLIVGLDGFSTLHENFRWLHYTWPLLCIELVFVVDTHFLGSMST
ncbi:hypothetical protein EJ08DRAFT_569099, partial [Tothia fuscella]